ncbi:MAG: hypothetical protein JO125_15145 [Chloroflexi bacterium]|nr:hypothetical protein [Ktedonobacteraceae bacterium]MBV9020260.1 hypothetical protein [Ktedonobacteraceae bacterium]MBV9708732.1 hypothetical protein [Chloroflexota bacterium]
MTRDFNKQRRDDSRPSSRNQSSSGYREQRYTHPTRPRLNREIVDRAWESGAQQQHADYHPRRQNNQPLSHDRRNYQQPDNFTPDNGRRNGRVYDYREAPRNTPRSFERTHQGNNTASRHFDSGRRNFDERQRPEERRGPAGERGRHDPQEYGPRYNTQTRGPGNHYGERDQYRGNQRRNFDSHDQRFRESDRPAHNTRYDERQFRQERYSESTHRPPHRGHQETTRRSPNDEQFEGDYEHFGFNNRSDTSGREFTHHSAKKRQNDQYNTRQADHLTHLPDGRVIKGSRPAQREEAQYWTNIAHDTEALVGQIHVVPTEEKVEAIEHQSEDTMSIKATPTKLRRRATSTGTRQKKVSGAKPRSSGPKPSRRGFKWPTP